MYPAIKRVFYQFRRVWANGWEDSLAYEDVRLI